MGTGILPIGIGLAHAIAMYTLVGFIWSVQLVIYPQFSGVDFAQWPEYHRNHCQRISVLAVPLMSVELITAVGLLWLSMVEHSSGALAKYLAANVGLVFAVWLSTAFIQVPLHRKLETVTDNAQRLVWIKALVITNWIRTVAWSLRGLGWAWWLMGWLRLGF